MKKAVLIFLVILIPVFLCQCSKAGDYYINKADEFLENNDLESALEQYEKAILENPGNIKAYIGKSRVLDIKDMDKEALEVCEKAFELDSEEPELYDLKGSLLVDLGEAENALANMDKAISLSPSNGSYYSNKAYVLNKLGRYEEAIECCNKAIELDPDMDMAYNNKAFSQDCLGKQKEALDLYDKSVEINPYNYTAYYNKAVIYFDLKKYKNSLDSINKALSTNINKELLLKLYIKKSEVLNKLEEYEEAGKYADKALSLDTKSSQAYMMKGISSRYLEKYEDAIKYFDKSIEIDNNNTDAYVNKAKLFCDEEKYDQAVELCEKALEINKSSPFAYTTLGVIEVFRNNYRGSLKYFDLAIENDPRFMDAYDSKAYVLFYCQKNYSKCLDFVMKANELFSDTISYLWYIADCYSYQGKSDSAIEYYNKLLELDPYNEEALFAIATEYYYNQDYENAEIFNKKVLELNEGKQDALSLKSLLEKAKLPEAERVINFVRDNYLYYDKINDFDKLSKKLTEIKDNVTNADIERFIESIRYRNDIFTFFIQGKDYDEVINLDLNNNIYSEQINDKVFFLKFNSFTYSTGYKFREIIDNIKNPEETVLIIDLRDNSGGLLAPSNEILDCLLPQCTTSYLVYRDGYMESYDSDEAQTRFKHIYIIVNEYSASSSEVLSLGLKKYLKNVTIVGKPTLGKGVGQIAFENKKKKYMIYLVSFYWNVREENISGGKINPDVYVGGNSDQSYLNAVMNRVK